MKIWLNGSLIDEAEARIAPTDRGLLLGDGLFETMAAENGAVPELARHHARLRRGAELLRLPVHFTPQNLAQIVAELLAANGLTLAAVRLTLTRGSGPRGLLPGDATTPTLMLTASAMPAASGPARLITAGQRRDESSILSTIKSLNYLPNVLARIEAAEAGADDALLLNHAGRVAEASASNVFVRLAGRWITPPVSEGALPGVRRAVLLEAGRVQEAPVSIAELVRAEALCLGNALSMRAVASLDGRALPELALP